ncbi:hypothetical protein [Paraliomyxa miuraensis]|uniref:hypothetical protein n=1 Tax=Paraliomyxa miuraensis TaxID=376150 RepID=UPI00225504D0|nr:hypothetical protein [Paraliomyxa miuraensis]MCX4241091.1 hypothetical protein [Paraliomyxa miuraensis]
MGAGMRELQWSAGIGDPTFMGWLTVVAYFAATWLCLRAFMVEKAGPPRPYRHAIAALWRVVRRHWPRPPAPARRAGLWVLLAAILAVLGVNKQLDLQSLITELGRIAAIEGGWYEQRRPIQVGFIGAVLVAGAGLVVALGWLARGHLRDFRLALGGMVVLVTFVVLRATSFHHIDILIGTRVAGLELNWVLELGGISLVAVAAGRRLRQAGAPLWRGWPGSGSGSGGSGGSSRPTAPSEPRAAASASPAAAGEEPPVVGKITQLG